MRTWKLARRELSLERTLVMGVLNVTPDSFSDGGRFHRIDAVLHRAEEIIAEGADILDIGGESTRPGGEPVSVGEESRRVLPVIVALSKRFDVPISIDTTKPEVARAALELGAEVVNDISGLRFAPELADVAANARAGLVLMHSRGSSVAELHTQPPASDIFSEVSNDFRRAIAEAEQRGVSRGSIALDPGIGFGKTLAQNLELLARLDELTSEFADFPSLIGTSRKSFIGKILNDAPADQRLHGTLATIAVSIMKGAAIIRVHDVRAAVEAAKVADAICHAASQVPE